MSVNSEINKSLSSMGETISRSFFIALLVLSSFGVNAQCVQSVNFNNWVKEGDPSGNWAIQNGGAQLLTTVNTNYPTFYVGPDTLINVRITGKFKVTVASDDDYLGFVFGLQDPVGGQTWNATTPLFMDMYLFDWKMNWQNYIGYIAQEGFSLNKVNGSFNYNFGSVFPPFWVHTNSATFNVLQTSFSSTSGWAYFQTYDFELLYTPTRAVILIDNDTIFEEVGCFPPGRFGFYNYSQANAQYWDFNYELYIDFLMEAEDVCLGDTAKFIFIDTGTCFSANAFSTLDTFYWDLGDGTITNDTNPQHIYPTADSFLVSLIATDINGCTDTNSKTIYIHNTPVATMGWTNSCFDDSTYFGDSTYMPYGRVTDWWWDFGDGSGSDTNELTQYLYGQPGTYNVSMAITTNAGCIDTTDTVVTIYENPTPDFDFDNVCYGTQAQFFDQSTQATYGIVNRYWDMQNDSTTDKTSLNPTFSYPSHGSYDVELKVVDSYGCRDSVLKTILIHPKPEADFKSPNACFGDENFYHDSTTIAGSASIVSWLWQFGDGDSSTLQAPSHVYPNPGLYNVYLTVTSDSGCVDSKSRTARAYDLPVADFEGASTCDNVKAEFVSTATNQWGSIPLHYWQFGVGEDTSYQQNPSYDFQGSGELMVTYAVTTSRGCKDTIVKPFRVYPTPNTVFSWDNDVCAGQSMAFYNQSTIIGSSPLGDSISDWYWLFNNQDTLYDWDPVYTTDKQEDLFVELFTISNYGCKTSFSGFPSVFPVPKPSIILDTACERDVTIFKDNSTINSGIIASWHWDMGDGNVYTSEFGEHIYNTFGAYDLTLVAGSDKGCKDTAIYPIRIHEKPGTDFSIQPDSGCSPLVVTLENNTSISEGNMTFKWFINDTLFSEDEHPAIILHNDTLEPIQYKVRLTATSDKGCVQAKTDEQAVLVLPSPESSFDFSPRDITMVDPVVSFKNTSEQGVRWWWGFGDDETSTSFEPRHVYNISGDYPVELVTWNEYNCPDTALKTIIVSPLTTLYFPASFTPNGDGINDFWKVYGFNEDKYFELKIFDRWGKLIMETKDYSERWDGTINNIPAPNGAYAFWVYMESSSSGEFIEDHGTFLLIR